MTLFITSKNLSPIHTQKKNLKTSLREIIEYLNKYIIHGLEDSILVTLVNFPQIDLYLMTQLQTKSQACFCKGV